jgi:two-component system LytT family sensor kinase
MARWIAVIWFVLGIITATQVIVGMTAAGMPVRPWTMFWTTMAAWLLLAFAAPGILWLSRRFPLGRGNWRNLPLHVAAAIGVSVAHAAWTAGADYLFQPLRYARSPYWTDFLAAMCTRFSTGLIVYAATLLIANTLDSVRRLARRQADATRLEGELSKAQLAALRRQLEPHFLFNTMNGIAGLIRESRNKEAVGMIAGLGDLLRRVLNDSGRQLVPLGEEVEFLRSYIAIQSMRFGDRLKVAVNVPRELFGAQIPPLILQPVVENAIVHGVSKRIEGGTICVTAREQHGALFLSVTNEGPPVCGRNSGVGISNTRARLAKLYGGDYLFDLRNGDNECVEAVIRVPYRTFAS